MFDAILFYRGERTSKCDRWRGRGRGHELVSRYPLSVSSETGLVVAGAPRAMLPVMFLAHLF